MKVENFEAAVHFYGKAIELNPANAVYFCNRYWLGAHGGSVCTVTWGLFSQSPRSAAGGQLGVHRS